MSSSATNLKMFKVWFDCTRQLKATRCWELTSRLAATTNNSFSGFIKSDPSTTIIYFLWTLLRHGYIERRRHGHNSNFLRATESCTRLHQAAPGCTRLHQAAPNCPLCISVVQFPHILWQFQCKIIRLHSVFLIWRKINSTIQEKSKHICDLCQISFSNASNLSQQKI